TQVTSATIGTTTYGGFAGSATGVVSVGAPGAERQITNVAPGQVTSSSTDAINGSELYSVASEVEQSKTHYVSINDGGTQQGNYNNNGATAANSIAIGPGATATVNNSVALGANSQAITPATQVTSATIGTTTYGGFAGSATGVVSVGAPGAERQITNVAPGRVTSSSTDAINGSELYAVASEVEQSKTHYVSINDGGTHQGNYDNNGATAANSIAIGPGATATVNNSVALGANSQATTQAVQVTSATIGGTTYSGFAGSATGVVSVGAPGAERQIINVAPGSITSSSTDAINGSQLYAVANEAADSKTHYVSITDGGSQAGNYNNNGATGKYAIAIGPDTVASADTATALGHGATASGIGATALGDAAQGTGGLAAAMGNNATASGALSLALGADAVASVDNSVALGAGSVTAPPTQVTTATVGTITYGGFAGSATGVVSVGAPGAERQITNVAPGAIDVTSTDAINGSQLYAVANEVAESKTHYVSINDGGKQQSNFNDDGATGINSIAVGPGAVSGGNGSVALGSQARATLDGAIAIGQNALTNVANSVAIGQNALVTVANSVAVGEGSVANNFTQVTSATVGVSPNTITFGNFAGTATGAVSVGTIGAERQITNVAPGAITSSSTDAINGSQLYSAVNALDHGGGGTTGNVHYLSINDGQNQQANYNNDGASGVNAIAIGPGAAARANETVALGANTAAIANDSTALGAFAAVTADSSVALGAHAAANLANSVALGAGSQATTPATPVDSATVGGLTFGPFAGSAPIGVVSVGYGNGGERQIVNVAAGQVTANSTDAINGSQLYWVASEVASLSTSIGSNGGNGTNGNGGNGHYVSINDGGTHAGNYNNEGATGNQSIAIGPNARSAGNNSVALGDGSTSSGTGSTAVGSGSVASGNFSKADGYHAMATGDNSSALGANTTASGSGATAIGANATAGGKGSVALGMNSVANEANTVSVGSPGNERRITNVAPGLSGTDAVNMSQLMNVQSGINDLARKAYSGIAAATALTMIPEVDKDKTIAVGIGGGSYEGYSAGAIGINVRLTENLKMKAGVGVSAASRTYGGGLSYQW
ncbi:YadA family autotransporter adhesin, partial [Paraburkholderia humisilvae]|uniref:YadA family autotransporter adhesin n=1 Tax=Paraburkholderia humisilvae TaxID=627669 RepID=UPI0035EC8066